MNKQDIYNLLKEKGIEHQIFEHEAVYTIEGMMALGLPDAHRVAKNLFLRDDKKHFYLLVTKEDRKINMKELQAKLGTRRLSFANETQLMDILGLISGAVCPFGVLNDKNRQVTVFFDDYFSAGTIGVHPLDNTASVFLKVSDIVDIIKPYCLDLKFVNLE
ncbi:MAG: prolyl-tRNA synthetase associated domain-containing protein [Oscillospiraceae bacterium]|nr:prolyl-tRNA synthetase associated domain-containing protein [Oscillospiraceae bacterium]MBQ6850527.1 prolyl-tRNA synthetase associated domain-containing protein [Oscillospiraceae bacterium]